MDINGLNTDQYLIDSKSAASISESLFSALEKKSVDYSKTNLSGFKRTSLGVDLYNAKTDINTQRQIAITSSGAFETGMNLSAVQQLNSFAAAKLYSSNIVDSVGGKMTIEAAQAEIMGLSSVENIQNSISVFETDKEKKDSNPFSFDEFFATTENSEKEDA